MVKLTLVLRFLDHLRHHSLHDGNVTVQSSSNETRQQCNPVLLGQTENQTRNSNASKPDQDNRFSAIAIRECAPTHGSDSFRNSVGGDEETSVERRICLIAIVQVFDHGICVCQDGVKRDGLGKATYR